MISLPRGKMVEKNADLLATDFLKKLVEMQKMGFTGYVALCVKGLSGLEEATVLYDEGKLVGCFYEYYKFNKTFEGREAFQRVLNASAAKNGVFDVIALKTEQVRLVLAVNEKIVFVPAPGQIEHAKVAEFSPLFEQNVTPESEEKVKSDVLKRFKLQDLA